LGREWLNSRLRRIKGHQLVSVDEVLKSLDSSRSGLNSKEASRRLSDFGYNEVEEKKTNAVVRFLTRFWGPTAWMLETVAVLSFLIGPPINMYLVIALLVFNALIGFSQESRSLKAFELLRKRLSVNSKVLRDGGWILKPAREVVPGDILLVRVGDVVPADMRLIEGQVLVDQSSLTGESVPVVRDVGDLVYASSLVRRSEAQGVATSTGSRTFYGKTVTLVKTAGAKSHVEELIADVVTYMLLIVSLVATCVLAYSLIIGVHLPDILNFVLMLLVSSVPIALPAMFTVTMTVAALRLHDKGVLVTRITAVEDAATMTVICTDKTGTITENKLSVMEPVAVGEFRESDVLLMAMLASEEASQDPIDTAIIKYARSIGIKSTEYKVHRFTPFDPMTKRTEALVEGPRKRQLKVMKGAPSVILEIAELDSPKTYWQIVDDLSAKGYRVLSVAIEEKGTKSLVGFIPFQDKPRRDSRELVSELGDLGVKIKMVTGDGASVAMAVAKQVGIGGESCTLYPKGEKIDRRVSNCDIFADVFPEDKLKIVRSLQSGHHTVGMTGDGVNDAPALKQAEVGVAVESATDAARAAASVVLTNRGLSGIVELVMSGRESFQRMYTWILNRIVKTFQISIFLAVSFFLLNMLVTTAIQLVLLLFLIDFVTISLATDRVKQSSHPEKWDIGKMTKAALSISLIVLLEMFLGLFLALKYLNLNTNQLHTFVFYMLMVSGVVNVLVVRERGALWNSRPGNALSVALIADIIIATVLCLVGVGDILTQIPLMSVLIEVAIAALMILPKDYVKRAILKREYGGDTRSARAHPIKKPTGSN
jgi:H+-transporting ATPase